MTVSLSTSEIVLHRFPAVPLAEQAQTNYGVVKKDSRRISYLLAIHATQQITDDLAS